MGQNTVISGNYYTPTSNRLHRDLNRTCRPGFWFVSRKTLKTCFPALIVVFAIFAFPRKTFGQGHGLELNGGWAHVTSDNGTDGFTVGGAWWFGNRFTIAGDYDDTWDTSNVSNFAFTQVGAIVVKSHLQDALFGPRVFFPVGKLEKHKLDVFGEAEFGLSTLNQKVQQVAMPTLSASDTAFSWMLGGGVDYVLSDHWLARGKLDYLRTHLANQGQSRLRLAIEIAFTFGGRDRK
jgi:Outer membrane protein beta-barrel domain